MPKKSKKQTAEEVGSSFTPEKKYVAIREDDAQTATKTRILWLSVTALSLVVVFIWFGFLRARLKEDAGKLEFFSLMTEISQSVSNFDQQIKNSNPEIKDADLDKIKDDLINELQQSPDSSLWPTHQIAPLGISVQYPDGWILSTGDESAVISADVSNTSSSDIKITIATADNLKKYSLPVWVEKTQPETIADYSLEEPIFKFSDNPSDFLMYVASSSVAQLDTVYLINSTSTKKVYLVNLRATTIQDNEKKIVEEIVKTIKILK